MKFETVLNAYKATTIEAFIYFIDESEERHRHRRQREAFHARLIKMYEDARNGAITEEMSRQVYDDPLPKANKYQYRTSCYHHFHHNKCVECGLELGRNGLGPV